MVFLRLLLKYRGEFEEKIDKRLDNELSKSI